MTVPPIGQLREWARLNDAGLTIREIADRHGIADSSLRRWLRSIGHSTNLEPLQAARRRVRLYPQAIVDQVRSLYASGNTQAEIAEALGTTQKIVWNIMRRHEIAARPAIPRDQRGPRGHGWRPHSTNYTTLHNRVEAARGKPTTCETCGLDNPDAKYEWANLTGQYQEISDYARMCIPCHRRFDAERRRETGQLTGIPR